MNEKKEFLRMSEAAALSGLHPHTIRKLYDTKVITGYTPASGQRRINKKDLQRHVGLLGSRKEVSKAPRNFLYARVSTRKQKSEGDLDRQIDFLRESVVTNGKDYELVVDVGSGINFKRKGFKTILDTCLQGNVGEVVVAHRDRLCRFGFELIDEIVRSSGGKIVVVGYNKNESETIERTAEQELSDDLLAIIHIFTCRQMGRRKYTNKRERNIAKLKDKIITNTSSENNT